MTAAATPPAARAVTPVEGPLAATVTVPGSKSLTNRALVCAALARGTSVVRGALVADDTEAMRTALARLGAGVEVDEATGHVAVTGTAGRPRPGPVELDLRLSGTTSRFLLPVVALGEGRYLLDGRPPLRARPMGPVLDGIRALGAAVEHHGEPGHLPVTVVAPGGLEGGEVAVAGDVSSQFVSGLLLAAPCTRRGLRLRVTTPLVARPYVELTTAVMAAFGAVVAERPDGPGAGHAFEVAPGGYRAATYDVEPDASTASYFLAAAAIAGGRVTVEGLGEGSRQGDARFADLLAAMGARVERTATSTTVVGTGRLRGLGEVDMRDMPDMAQTLAAVAVFAEGATRVTGIEVVRGHETDRIAAVVAELRRAGIRADEHRDGFTVHPGTPQPARIRTYDDHRMAMSFALLGLRAPGIEIADPDCVGKTFPGFWQAFDALRDSGTAAAGK
ncbi:MAG TPA: 3-phosphoshikimate 1-carboxyvinyltransferase [Acidimicrobiales bacterium]|nr:3-phosphoshikimate 1-carboxyvinyltransferase [Acidimicrobiales bacterium]